MFSELLTFPYTGAIVNALLILVGTFVGCFWGKHLSKRVCDAMMSGIGLCVAYVGISGAVGAGSSADDNPVIPVIAIAGGVFVGTLLDIDGLLDRFGKWVERKAVKRRSDGSGNGSVAEGFINASLLFCIGSMAIIGSLNAGLSGDNATTFTKAVIDMISAVVLSVGFGWGVALSFVPVLCYQGGLTALAVLIEPLLTPHIVNEMNVTGSLLILAIGLNMLGLTRLKLANFLPAVLFAVLLAVWI